MAPLALVYFAEYVLQVRIMPANLDDATVQELLSFAAEAHAMTWQSLSQGATMALPVLLKHNSGICAATS